MNTPQACPTPSPVNSVRELSPWGLWSVSRPLMISLAISLLSHCPSAVSQTELVKSEMQSLYTPLRALIPFIASEEKFTAKESSKAVSKALEELRAGFHTVEAIPSRYKTMPGFSAAVIQMREVLDDSTSRFEEGKVKYAWWRSRVVPGACFSCHATYNIKSVYSPNDVVNSELPLMDRARFLLATRQFPQAEEALLEVLKSPSSRIDYSEALRSLLVVELRVYNDFSHTVATLKEITKATQLTEEDTEEVQHWIKTLVALGKSPAPGETGIFARGADLVSKGLPKSMDEYQDTVLLLLGSAYLHRALENSEIKPAERQRALYLIGSTYAAFSNVLYFADSWSALYLEQCITEFPGSDEAKRAFKRYKESVFNEFTGSSGTHLPAEITLKIESLRKKAYSIPEFSGKL